jgi:hypothetical protein
MSAWFTIVDLRRWRMRFGRLVPSKCRLPECARITLPVDVTLNRFAAPRCVFSFSFLFFFNVASILPKSVGHQLVASPGLFAAGAAAFFGASNASKIFASMRGPNSTKA